VSETTHAFQIGDVVQAVVNGRKMTVAGYDPYGRVICRWRGVPVVPIGFTGIPAPGPFEQAAFGEARLKKVPA
jgi:uncharacterized protein YodC (DUF2158 family)